MKFLVFIGIFFIASSAGAQLMQLPEGLKNIKYQEILNYLDNQIQLESSWTERKIDLTLVQSYCLTKNWEYEKAYDLVQKIPTTKVKEYAQLGQYYLLKAITYKYKNEPQKAAYNYKLSATYYQNKNNIIGQVETMIEEAEFRRKYNQHDIGLEKLDEAEVLLARAVGVDYWYMRTYNRRAAIINESGIGDTSIFYSNKCLELSRKLDEKYFQAISCNELGFSYKNKSLENRLYLDSSIYYYKQSEKLFRELGLRLEALQVKDNWITAYSHNFYDNHQLIDWYKQIETEVKRDSLPFSLKNTYLNINTNYIMLNDSARAFAYFIKYSRLNERLIIESKQLEISKLQDDYEAYKLKAENQKIREEKRKDELKIAAQREEQRWLFAVLFVLLGLLLTVLYLFRQRRSDTKKLAIQNREKEVLIHEIHHRVKNNLNFISSLLQMQQRSRKEISESIVLQDAKLRIESMSLVHEMLYTENYDNLVNLKRYCSDLISLILDGLNVQENEIRVNIEVDSISVSQQDATSIGLIINELFNNSVKHAFKDLDTPVISIDISEDQGNRRLVLNYSDNGKGFNIDAAQRKSFGLKLISLLSKQMKADIQWNTNSGVNCTIKIPVVSKTNR